jgi:hypothetical protein
MAEAARRNIEQAMRFLDDLANANGPGDVAGLQFGFAVAQVRLFSEQMQAMQHEFARLFLPSQALDKRRGPPAQPSR